MIHLLAEYEIKDGTRSEVLAALRPFTQAVAAAEPATEYRAYQVAGSQRFVHVMAFVNEAAREAHSKAAYTQRFVAALYPCCVTEPRFCLLQDAS